MQVTSAKAPSVLFNTATFAKLLDKPLKRQLAERAFSLVGEQARQHLVVHVRDAGRGTGNVRFFCELEVYVYSEWPGVLGFSRNKGQNAQGKVSGDAPQVHASLRFENQRRAGSGQGTELEVGAEHCATQLAENLVNMRERAPILVDAPAEPPPQKVAVEEEKRISDSQPNPPFPAAFEVVRRVSSAPGNLTLTPAGRILVSLHQFFQPEFPAAEVDEEGKLTEFAEDANLDSVLGIQCDENGVVWLLDNGMKSTKKPRLVGYHSVREKMVADIDLTSVMPKDAFFNDLVIDLDHDAAYLADPAGGKNAALVVVDLKTQRARRVLEGHPSVIPEDVELALDGKPLEMQRPGGALLRPRVGLNPIAADADNEWLYFGPMHGTSLYRIKTALLRDAHLAPEKLAYAVERFSEKPVTDGISIDDEGNVYLADLANNAIVRVSKEGEMVTLAKDPKLSWVDAFSFGPDGQLYAVVNQLHLSPPFQGGKDATVAPFLIIKISTDAGGTVGR